MRTALTVAALLAAIFSGVVGIEKLSEPRLELTHGKVHCDGGERSEEDLRLSFR